MMKWNTLVIRTKWFPNKPAIHHLHIEDVYVTGLMGGLLDEEQFKPLKTLELINLPFDQGFTEQVFNGTINLSTLFIRNVSIPFIQLKSMPSLMNLTILYCAQIDIELLMAHAKFPKLKSIRFNFNRFSEITRDTFSDLPVIEELDLSHNQIESVHEIAFSRLPSNISIINLANNKLRKLPDQFFTLLNSPLQNDYVIHLYGNSFGRNCESNRLKYSIEKYSIKFYGNVSYILPSFNDETQGKTWHEFCLKGATEDIPNKIIINTHVQNQNVSKLVDNYKSIDIEVDCNSFNETIPTKNFFLIKPKTNIRIDYKSTGTYGLSVANFSLDYFIVGFENSRTNIGDNNLTQFSCISNTHKNHKETVHVKPPIKPNHLYRFCVVMRNELEKISPLECVSFFSKTKITAAAWISIDHRTPLIAVYVFFSAATLVFGAYLPFVVAKKYPELFGIKVKKPVIILRNSAHSSFIHLYVFNRLLYFNDD